MRQIQVARNAAIVENYSLLCCIVFLIVLFTNHSIEVLVSGVHLINFPSKLASKNRLWTHHEESQISCINLTSLFALSLAMFYTMSSDELDFTVNKICLNLT
jgi:hypothetical protein